MLECVHTTDMSEWGLDESCGYLEGHKGLAVRGEGKERESIGKDY